MRKILSSYAFSGKPHQPIAYFIFIVFQLYFQILFILLILVELFKLPFNNMYEMS